MEAIATISCNCEAAIATRYQRSAIALLVASGQQHAPGDKYQKTEITQHGQPLQHASRLDRKFHGFFPIKAKIGKISRTGLSYAFCK